MRIGADAVINEGVVVVRNKLEQFSEITACIGVCMAALFEAQKMLVDLMCEECNIPSDMKPTILNDMNKVMGVKKL